MKISKYPDGTSYVDIDDLTIFSGETTFRINSYEDLWHLNQVVDAYNNLKITPTVMIPNLIDAQADRRFDTGQSSGLKLVLKFLNGMDANFKIFHPHNPEVVEAMMDNVEIIDNSYFIKEVLSEIHCENTNIKRDKGLSYHLKVDNLILMSSDAGGFKPLIKLADKLWWKGETYSASKARLTGHSETRLKQLIDREDFGGKDILIVDDISVYGGTFKGLSEMLRKKNCGKLYLAISHMTVKYIGEDPVTNYFDKVFTTNSKFNKYVGGVSYDNHGNSMFTGQPKNLEIIKIF